MAKVFVYGTLRPHRAKVSHKLTKNYDAIKHLVKSSKPAYVYGVIRNINGYYPAFYANASQTVQGELLEVDDKALRLMDYIEGHPNFFRRVSCRVETSDGPVEDTWIYIGPSAEYYSQYPVIESGDWLA